MANSIKVTSIIKVTPVDNNIEAIKFKAALFTEMPREDEIGLVVGDNTF